MIIIIISYLLLQAVYADIGPAPTVSGPVTDMPTYSDVWEVSYLVIINIKISQ